MWKIFSVITLSLFLAGCDTTGTSMRHQHGKALNNTTDRGSAFIYFRTSPQPHYSRHYHPYYYRYNTRYYNPKYRYYGSPYYQYRYPYHRGSGIYFSFD